MSKQNVKLSLAHDFILNTQRNLFLTGKAGTGKTTFLHSLQNRPPKRMVVTAPTGVAAINARGVTLHSFFQLPFAPFIPGSDAVQRRFSSEKISIIKSLDLLVIDEISMVRADVLDAVDFVLRRYRRSNAPFGGVQLLMIGDLHQLSPVVKHEEQVLLQDHYATNYFFSSIALLKTDFISIELEHIYRQSDPYFIELLNRVRDNNINRETLTRLNARCIPQACIPADGATELPITLSTHNRSANAINDTQLRNINARPCSFIASIVDNYPEHAYPCAQTLTLKVGAQVMFTRNDPSSDKRFYNGKIGRIAHIGQDSVQVSCAEEASAITAEPVTWENVKYALNPQTKEISEEIIGTFTQLPLRLAWAITIHKSQGLTFDNVIIDADAAFAHGQVYVALSRCKTLEGITLRKALSTNMIKTDLDVEHFVHQAQKNSPTEDQLKEATISYQQQLITDCFNLGKIGALLNRLSALPAENQNLIHYRAPESLAVLQQQVSEELLVVAEKFCLQLQSHYSNSEAPQDNAYIQERIQKASRYYLEKLNAGLRLWLESVSCESENKELRKKAKQLIVQLQQELSIKISAISSCQLGFSTASYLTALSVAEIEDKPAVSSKVVRDNFSSGDLKNPELFKRLKTWRDIKADDLEVSRYAVLHQRVLVLCAAETPTTTKRLRKIRGVGKRTLEKYGDELVAIVLAYYQENKIVLTDNSQAEDSATITGTTKSDKNTTRKTNTNNSDTKKRSYELFLGGCSIEKIAEQRNLVKSTIVRHLSHYLSTGALEITQFMKDEKVKRIEEVLLSHEDEGLNRAKKILGNDVSYGELNMVKAHMRVGSDST